LKKLLASIAAGGLLLAAPHAFAQSTCTSLTITGHPEYAPIGYRDGDAIAGAGAALVEEIGAQLGVPVVSTYTGTWEEAQQAARAGDADIIFGIYYNDERATYLDYVEPPFTIDPVVVFVPASGDFAFTGRDDLIGKQGVTNVGESFGVEFDAFMNDNLDVARADGVEAAFDDLLAGRADYMIFGLYPGLAIATEVGIRDQIAVLSPNLVEADMYFAFSKRSPCLSLMGAFGTEIATMRDSGRIDQLIQEATAAWNAMN
jgi:polar amino acid transport system substrate-binding protein